MAFVKNTLLDLFICYGDIHLYYIGDTDLSGQSVSLYKCNT